MSDTEQQRHFASAASRHFKDASYLHDDDRLPTADHLYGFAAECAVKSLLLRYTEVTMGSPKPQASHPDDPSRVIEFGHVNELIPEVRLFARGRRGARMCAALGKDLQAFRQWRVRYRYEDGSYAQADVVTRRRDAAHRILILHERAVLNGGLP